MQVGSGPEQTSPSTARRRLRLEALTTPWVLAHQPAVERTSTCSFASCEGAEFWLMNRRQWSGTFIERPRTNCADRCGVTVLVSERLSSNSSVKKNCGATSFVSFRYVSRKRARNWFRHVSSEENVGQFVAAEAWGLIRGPSSTAVASERQSECVRFRNDCEH